MSSGLNRAQRRAKPAKPAKPTKYRKRHDGGMLAIGRSAPFTEEEFARLSNEARLAWHRLQTGDAGIPDFDNLVMAINTTKVLAEGFGIEAVEVVEHAQVALYEIQLRYKRLGKFGVDAFALKHMPDALDFHDECLRSCSPWQMTKALEEVLTRLNRI